MRKLSLVMLAMLIAMSFGWANDGGNTTTAEEGEGKVKEALKKVFKKDEAANDESEEAELEDEDGEEKAFPLSLGMDIVSRYVWRGIDFGASPALQPYIEYSVGNDVVTWGMGVWGSYAFTGPVASEFDLYSYISAGPVTLNFTDYFFPGEVWGGDKYFTYKKGKTGHVYELMVSIAGDKAPVYGMAAVNLGGADQSYSSYFEVGATVYTGIDLFVGMAYDNYTGFYLAKGKQKFNVINVGMTVSHDIELKKVSIPISASVIFNPEARNAYFVAAIGLSN